MPSILGVWRLRSITHRGKKVGTSQTHLVVHEGLLWEVDPSATYYEGEPGPERDYEFRWRGRDGCLEIHVPNRGSFCAIARVSGDELHLRYGGVFGQFPNSFDDEHGNLELYERETDASAVVSLSQPPARVARTIRKHRMLGELAYDEDLEMWTGKVRWGRKAGVIVHVNAPRDCSDELFDGAAERLQAVRCQDVKAYASSKLLALKNETWLSEGERAVSAKTFQSRLAPESFNVESDGGVSVFFEDGDLFWGHVVIVKLDAKLRPVDAGIAG